MAPRSGGVLVFYLASFLAAIAVGEWNA